MLGNEPCIQNNDMNISLFCHYSSFFIKKKSVFAIWIFSSHVCSCVQDRCTNHSTYIWNKGN